MPIVFKEAHKHRTASLSACFDDLDRLLAIRNLRTPSEGAKDAEPWPQPDKMGATFGGDEEIRVAVGKVKAHLAEIAKIKTVTVSKADRLKPAPAAQAKVAAKAEPEL